MQRIHARIRYLKLGLERLLTAHLRLRLHHLHPHLHRRHPPPQHDRLLAFHPMHLTRERSWAGRPEEEELGRVGVDDVHDGGVGAVLLASGMDDGA